MSEKWKTALYVCAGVMLVSAVPLALWCVSLINQASVNTDYPGAGIGCFLALIGYALWVPFAVIVFLCTKKDRFRVIRILAIVQLVYFAVCTGFLLPYTVLTLPPYLVLSMFLLVLSRTGQSKG